MSEVSCPFCGNLKPKYRLVEGSQVNCTVHYLSPINGDPIYLHEDLTKSWSFQYFIECYNAAGQKLQTSEHITRSGKEITSCETYFSCANTDLELTTTIDDYTLVFTDPRGNEKSLVLSRNPVSVDAQVVVEYNRALATTSVDDISISDWDIYGLVTTDVGGIWTLQSDGIKIGTSGVYSISIEGDLDTTNGNGTFSNGIIQLGIDIDTDTEALVQNPTYSEDSINVVNPVYIQQVFKVSTDQVVTIRINPIHPSDDTFTTSTVDDKKLKLKITKLI